VKMIFEYMGQVLICVVSAGMLLVLFLTGENAQTRSIGQVVKERENRLERSMEVSGMGKVKERGVEFAYEEQCFQTGELVDVTKYFHARKRNGKRVKVKIEEIFPETYEVSGEKVKFIKEGIYEIRVSAAGYLYEVCVPVIQYAN